MHDSKKQIIRETMLESEREDKIYAIDLQMQEISVALEKYEFDIFEKGQKDGEISEEAYVKLKKEYKLLKKEKKDLIKNRKKTIWDKIPAWMAIYAVLQFILSIHYIQGLLGVYFAALLLYLMPGLAVSGIVVNLLSLVLTVLSILTSFIILLILKDKEKKRLFFIFFIIHSIETIITLSIMLPIILK